MDLPLLHAITDTTILISDWVIQASLSQWRFDGPFPLVYISGQTSLRTRSYPSTLLANLKFNFVDFGELPGLDLPATFGREYHC